MKSIFTAKITLWVNRLIFVVLAGLAIFLPKLLDWYCQFRMLSLSERGAITVSFYICAVVTVFALAILDKLLRSILIGQVFTHENVRLIRLIRWCCMAVSLICAPAAVSYLPLIFMVIIMAFLSLVVSVLASVMDAAVSIREENDLTV